MGALSPRTRNAQVEMFQSGELQEFLRESISFLKIADLIEETMMKVPYVEEPDLDDYLSTDEEARIKAFELTK